MGKKVLFIERNLMNEKLGIMYLSASLKASGHHASLVQTDKQNLDDFIRDYRPDFVAFSIMTGDHVHALKTARYVKEKYGIPNLFGGPHCTFFPEIGFEEDLDFVVQGQSEHLIIDIVEGRVKPGFHKAEMPGHLDNLPFPDRDIFYQYAEFHDRPMKNIMTSRACPYKCSYCFNHSQYALTKVDGETKKWFDRRSIENINREIHQIVSRYPLQKINFCDDSFIQSQAWLHEFLEGYTREAGFPWICSLRANCLDEELASKMAASGLEMVSYAMESADPDVQQRLLHRGHITNGDIIRAIELFDRYQIRARMQNIIGLPLSNPLEDALNTVQFNMRHKVLDSWCSIFQPYPRTALGQYCMDQGFITEDQLRYCTESFFDESKMKIENNSEIYALQKLWYFIVDSNLPLDLVQILIRGKFTTKIGDQIQKLRYHYSRNKLFQIDAVDPEKAVDLASREAWGNMGVDDQIQRSQHAAVIENVLKKTQISPRLISLLTQVEFQNEEIENLKKFDAGEKIYPTPLYTINDETGELADPNVSIYMRGVKNPEEADIRKMPDAHFMRDMAKVRQELTSFSEKKLSKFDLPSAHTPRLINHKVEAEKAQVDGIQDKFHRNQFLG